MGHTVLARSLLSIGLANVMRARPWNEKILVRLAQNDGAEEVVPYVESVARPGMTVVFLVYPAKSPVLLIHPGMALNSVARAAQTFSLLREDG